MSEMIEINVQKWEVVKYLTDDLSGAILHSSFKMLIKNVQGYVKCTITGSQDEKTTITTTYFSM